MRFLVTGGAGFIGSNFVRYLVEKYPDTEIVVLDKLTYAGRQENLADVRKKITFIKGDICREGDIKKAGACDVIFNFAAETHVDRSITGPDLFVKTDVLGTCALLNYAREHDISRYIQISTDEVYGSIRSGSFHETDILDPSSPYSASKAAAEHLAHSYFRTYDLPVITTRSSNNFGPYQYPEKLIPVLILKALSDQPLPIYGTGLNVRDWLYVGDNCTGIDAAYSRGIPGEIYNLGAGNERTNLEIAKIILSVLHKSEDLITFIQDRAGHDFRYSISSEKIRSLGWSPSHPFDEAMARTVEWYVKNSWWWKPLVLAGRS
ncbi:MAG: dTDP-glucose 4,6-dehydratase [Methanoregula sp.]|jgi:dTDP-glucose 4,6-dehydratase|uniref:dTDP-glucose 4,6-dehydratase n=1 Tax=Methanoregula sp. TaxID=2052170 RepID=UPI003C27083D